MDDEDDKFPFIIDFGTGNNLRRKQSYTFNIINLSDGHCDKLIRGSAQNFGEF